MKGQASLEFIVFVGIIFTLLAAASYSAIVSNTGISQDNDASEARRITSIIAGEINIATEVGTGYGHVFYIPDLLYTGTDYSIDVSQKGVVNLQWGGKYYSLPVLTTNVTGTVNKGYNKISNTNGVISFA